jgi:hypothetical protein
MFWRKSKQPKTRMASRPEDSAINAPELDALIESLNDPGLRITTERLLEGQYLRRRFEMIVVQMGADSESEMFNLATSICNIAGEEGIFYGGFTLGVLTFYVGLINDEADSRERRNSFVKKMIYSNGNSVKIIHGTCDGRLGSFGPYGRTYLVGLVPNSSSLLQKLTDMKFGQSDEI